MDEDFILSQTKNKTMKNRTIVIVFVVIAFLSMRCKKDENGCTNPKVSAGNDTTLIDTNRVVLKGVSSENNGIWSIVKGNGGIIDSSKSGEVAFTGMIDSTYALKLESTNSCGVSSDTVIISFKQKAFTVNEMSDNIHWIQQSCFRIEGSKYRIYTDPQSVSSGSPSADIILVTHSHGDHFSTNVIKNICTAKTIYIAPQDCNYTGTKDTMISLLPGEEYVTKNGIKIKAVPAYNSNHPIANKWVGYLITINGITIYHAGDTKRIEEMKTFTCDIALMPLGPIYTMSNVQEAVDATLDVQAKLAIPMHYGTAEGTLENAQTYKTLLEGKTPSIPVVVKTKGQ
jgi:L-ascorbate metabolism protein UlaG (beta-lactamase superfamily)